MKKKIGKKAVLTAVAAAMTVMAMGSPIQANRHACTAGYGGYRPVPEYAWNQL